MTTTPVSLHIENGVATITICRPERSNALRPEDFDLLRGRLLAASGDEGVRALVLTGAGGRAFCAGADLSGGPSFHKANGRTGLGDVLRAAWTIRKPIVGRINGACRGGGMALLGLCDAAVCVEAASFALPEIRLGFFPHVALCGWRSHRAERAVIAMAGDGAAMDAHEAQRRDLVDEVAPAEALDERVSALVARLLGSGSDAQCSARRPQAARDALGEAVNEAERLLGARTGAA